MIGDFWVYLDTNVIITLVEALSGSWRPPQEPLERTDRQRLAAARVFFYGYRERWSRWYLVTSSEARRELLRSDSLRWMEMLLLEIDRTADVVDPAELAAEAERFRAAGLKDTDALHLAQASVRPWVVRFVTDDDRLRNAARRAGLPIHLVVSSTLEAEEALHIERYEAPPIAPHHSSPLADQRWWIPGRESN